ncbi:MAG: hypothetical protein JWM47_1561 [Acidimicrobiales bacterium]|nr:hypothetical protein [Acidimicrobiales bacterium]
MAEPVGTSAPTGPGGMIPAEWPAQAADKIVETIGTVRDKTTKPALTAARAVVYGLLAGIVGTAALVLLMIMVIRFAANYAPMPGPQGTVWPIYSVLAVIMIAGGLFLLRRANRPPAEDD